MLGPLPRNPFSTRYTQPGVVPPFDAEGRPVDVPRLVALIHEHRGASIEGPHGTGKSTLLSAVAKVMHAEGKLGGTFRLRGSRDAFGAIRAILRAAPDSVVCLDGWDVLGPLKRVARCVAWWRRVGLVVTAHRTTGFQYNIRTAATLPLLMAIVESLPDQGGLIAKDDLADVLERHPDNIREAISDLYDRFEHRARMIR